ncbi:MAG: UvrB/UvrC motif-containing protein [Planctomycetota bacterium]
MKSPADDLRPLLDSWSYEEGKNIRRVKTPEGREVLQVRLPLGIEQYELDGRPDGRRPDESESWYHVYRDRADETPWDFTLDEESFERLREECMLYYHRYLLFFQINEYELCVRDTERNLGVLDFTAKYGDTKMSESLEQYRPYILRMNVMAKALSEIQESGNVERAMEWIQEGLDAIDDLPVLENNSVFQLEKARSQRSLQDLFRQLENHLPKSEESRLEEELKEAIDSENYEEAARIRDEIRFLEENGIPEGAEGEAGELPADVADSLDAIDFREAWVTRDPQERQDPPEDD